MNRLLFCLFAIGLTQHTATAQQHRIPAPSPPIQNVRPVLLRSHTARTGLEPVTPTEGSVPAAADRSPGEQIIGFTFYDLQTNASMPNRLHVWPDGRVSGVWNQSINPANNFLDRGTGYNKTDPATQLFDTQPTTRVENVRTAFPAYDVTASGEEWIFSHTNDPNPGSSSDFRIHYAHKADDAAVWTEGNLPDDAAVTESFGHLWPRVAVGGSDGQTLHVIALTTPRANAGNDPAALIDGLDGQLRYWRSIDGGSSWDIIDVPVPGISSDKWIGVSADAYALDAHDETVAILVTSRFNDAVMIKSADNGETWETPRTVHNFPLDLFVPGDSTYTFDDIATYYDPAIFPDSLAILSTDATGNLLVAPDGTVHVALPSLFVSAYDTTTSQNTYHPSNNLGIIYWNDGMPDHGGIIAAYSPDLDDDGAWGTASSEIFAGGDGGAFSSLPTLGLDDTGRLYITYISYHELAIDDNSNWHHRQPFFVRSEPGDFAAWSAPAPVLQLPLVIDPIIVELSEYYFPVMAKRVDNEAHIQYQHDYEFGIAQICSPFLVMENTIEYIAIPRYMLDPVMTAPALNASAVSLGVLPNPVTDARAQVVFELPAPAASRIEFYNVAGLLVRTFDPGNLPAGRHEVAVDVDGLPNGLYFVRVQVDGAAGVCKLVIGR